MKIQIALSAEFNSYLYHTAPLDRVLDILKSNELYVSRQSNGKRAVSLTRDKNYVRLYLKNYVRFTLDRNKLRQRYPLVPYSEMEVGKEYQTEEHCSRNIKDLKKYIAKIEIHIGDSIEPQELDSLNYLMDHRIVSLTSDQMRKKFHAQETENHLQEQYR